MTGSFRVAVVGVGDLATDRARRIAECEGISVAAVVTATAHPGAGLIGEEEGWRRTVQAPAVDAVVIGTSMAVQPQVALAALEAGKHVLCDSPIAGDLTDVDRLVEASHRRRVILFGGLSHRHRRAIRRVWHWIDDGVIGEPIILRCQLRYRPGSGGTTRTAAEARFALDVCGADLTRWLLGPCERVTAIERPPDGPAGAVLLHGSSGRSALVETHVAAQDAEIAVEVFGREGYASANEAGPDQRPRAILGRRGPHAPFREVVEEFAGPDPSAVTECEEFVAAIRSGRSDADWAGDAIEALRVVLASRRSERERTVVGVGTPTRARERRISCHGGD